MKKIKTKQQLLENWNPYLGSSCDNIESPSIDDFCFDMIDKPAWLEPEEIKDNDKNPTYPGQGYSIGAFYINGVPLSSWSAQFGASHAYHKKRDLMNYYYLNQITKTLFPNGYTKIKDNELTELTISKLSIVKMIPCNTGIGLNIHIRFTLNDVEIWGKFENVGVDLKPNFVCEEIKSYKEDDIIRIKGKLWNIIIDWFKPKSGVYKLIAKEIFIVDEFMQYKQIITNDYIEVLSSDETQIKIKHNDKMYFIKKPLYFWFNYYFVNV